MKIFKKKILSLHFLVTQTFAILKCGLADTWLVLKIVVSGKAIDLVLFFHRLLLSSGIIMYLT